MSKPVVVVVDPVSTGAYCLDYILTQNEFIVTTVWSPTISPAARALSIPGLNTTSHFTVPFTTLENTCVELRKLHGDSIVHVVSLSEPGVETADALADALKMPSSNGLRFSPHRRDKYLQLQRLEEYGLRTAQQKLVTTLEECIQFQKQLGTDIVLKPATSAGSDDVYKIPYTGDSDQDFELLALRFNSTFNKVNKMGLVNDKVIVQEFLSGEEFVVDCVTFQGQPKLISCWKYDKVSLPNSGDFVYLGMSLVESGLPKVKEMFDYIAKVLDSLEVSYFSCHAELIYTKNGPVLLEIGTRPHGGQGSFIPLQTHCLGFGIQHLLYATLLGNKDTSPVKPIDPNYTKPRYFDEFPVFPPLLHTDSYGYQMDLINYNPDGVLVQFNEDAMEQIKSAPTFIEFTNLPTVGEWLARTYDCFTIPASLVMAGPAAQVMEDFKLIRSLEKVLFITEPGPKPQ